MSVVIETTLGDVTVDLFTEQRPMTCLNFLKLCKLKYYNFNLFHTIQHGFIAQSGDPTGEGTGGQSVWGVLEGPNKRYFEGEKMPKIKHTEPGLLSMVATEEGMIGSQFFFTLASDLNSLDMQHCVIGEVTEGHDVLRLMNETICDAGHRPYQDVRVTHTVILEDPFNDPKGLREPSRSPSPSAERLAGGRIAPDEDLDETRGKTEEEISEMIQEKEAKARATILEIVGDLPDAEMAPPENVLFVCKLNPVTTDDDLEIIFSRFGKIVCCEVIRDKKSGDSLQYAFIEFDNKKACEDAFFKMDNVLIDDRRIHVDFSQSVSKIKWQGKGRGVIVMDNDGDVTSNERNIYKKNSYSEKFPRDLKEHKTRSNERHPERENEAKERQERYRRDDEHSKEKQNSSYDKEYQRKDSSLKRNRSSHDNKNVEIKNSERHESRERNSSAKILDRSREVDKFSSRSKDGNRTPDRSRERIRTPDRSRERNRTPDRSREHIRNPERCRERNRTPDRSRERIRTPDRYKEQHKILSMSTEENRTADKSRKNRSTERYRTVDRFREQGRESEYKSHKSSEYRKERAPENADRNIHKKNNKYVEKSNRNEVSTKNHSYKGVSVKSQDDENYHSRSRTPKCGTRNRSESPKRLSENSKRSKEHAFGTTESARDKLKSSDNNLNGASTSDTMHKNIKKRKESSDGSTDAPINNEPPKKKKKTSEVKGRKKKSHSKHKKSKHSSDEDSSDESEDSPKKSKRKRTEKKKKSVSSKKKNQSSSSSESSSSDSSESSDDSSDSSSESDKKKKKSKRSKRTKRIVKKKHSKKESSTSTSSDSSSTSSDDSSSSSDSSDSGHERSRKKSKNKKSVREKLIKKKSKK